MTQLLDKVLIDVEEQLKTLIKGAVLSRSKKVFDENPELASFSWNQYTTGGGSYRKKVAFYTTRDKPEINDQTSEWLPDDNPVVALLSSFRLEALILAFGENARITIYRDLTYDITNDP